MTSRKLAALALLGGTLVAGSGVAAATASAVAVTNNPAVTSVTYSDLDEVPVLPRW